MFGIPIPILVLLMGGSMILQQYLSPSTGMDPAQQRMVMVLMPVMFTVMFINFPSGLVLYWLVNNVLTIAQRIGRIASLRGDDATGIAERCGSVGTPSGSDAGGKWA